MPRKSGRIVKQPEQNEPAEDEELEGPEELEDQEEQGEHGEDEEHEAHEEHDEDEEREEPEDHKEDAKQLARNILDMKEQLDSFLNSLEQATDQAGIAITAAKRSHEAASSARSLALEAEESAMKAQEAAENVTSALDAAGIAGTELERIYRKKSKAIMRKVLKEEFDQIIAAKIAAAEAMNQDQPSTAAPEDEAGGFEETNQEPDPGDGQDGDGPYCYKCRHIFNWQYGKAIKCKRQDCEVRSHRKPECSKLNLPPVGGTWYCQDHQPPEDDDDGHDAGDDASDLSDVPDEEPDADDAPPSHPGENGKDSPRPPTDDPSECFNCNKGREEGELEECAEPGCYICIHRKYECSRSKDLKKWWCDMHDPAKKKTTETAIFVEDDEEDDEDFGLSDDDDEISDRGTPMQSDQADGDYRDDENEGQSRPADETHGNEDEDAAGDEDDVDDDTAPRCDICDEGSERGPLVKCAEPGCSLYVHRLAECNGPRQGDWYCTDHLAKRNMPKRPGDKGGGGADGGDRGGGISQSDRDGMRRISERLKDVNSVEYLKVARIGGQDDAPGKRKRSNLATQHPAKSLSGNAKPVKTAKVGMRASEAPGKPHGQEQKLKGDAAISAKATGSKRSSDDEVSVGSPPKRAKKEGTAAKPRSPPKLSGKSPNERSKLVSPSSTNNTSTAPPKPTEDPGSADETELPISAKQKKENAKKTQITTAKTPPGKDKVVAGKVEKKRKPTSTPASIPRMTRDKQRKADEEAAKEAAKQKRTGVASKKRGKAP